MIRKKNSENFQNTINSLKYSNQNIHESRNRKGIIFQKANINIGGSKPIKVHLVGRSPKNEKRYELNNNNNTSLISSFLLRKSVQNYKNNKSNTSSSFHKPDFKLMNSINTDESIIKKIIEKKNEKEIKKDENNNDNFDDKKGKFSKLKDLLTATKEIKKNYNHIIKKDIIPMRNIKKFETEDNTNNEIKNLTINNFNETGKIKNKKSNLLNLINTTNNNKEKIYNLIYEKNNFNSKNKNKIINNKEYDNTKQKNEIDKNDNTCKSEQKINTNISKYKMRNILSKNFSIQNNLESITINTHVRKSKSPIGLTLNKNLDRYRREKVEKDEITSLKSNNSKENLKINISFNTKTNDSNNSEKINYINNNHINNETSENNIKLVSTFQSNDKNNNIKSKYFNFNSPQKWNYNNNLNNLNFIQNRNLNNIKIDTNKSVELKSKLNKFKYLNVSENINFGNDKNEEININFDELILFEERLNDIYIAINGNENMEDGSMINECQEFFNFYLNSSLNNKLSFFFSNENFIIIQSSMNLLLFIIMIIYYLSLNSEILNEYISLLANIFNKFKNNFHLLVRQIEIYYNNAEFFEKNDNKIHFNVINNLIKNTSIYNINNLNEDEIILKIKNNCTFISNSIHSLLNIYYDYIKNNNNNIYEINCYNEFMNIFNTISIITEKDITNYFYNNIYKKQNINIKENTPKKINNIFLNYKSFNSTKNNISPIRQNNMENNLHKNTISFSNDIVPNINKSDIDIDPNEKMINNNYISVYRTSDQKNINQISNINKSIDNSYTENTNIIPPFIKTKRPKNKKYTLILDLDETLVHVKQINSQNSLLNTYNSFSQKIINLRPGLFSFLNTVKPYYEIISFSSASKAYADNILKKIETNQKYFDYNLYREHTTLYGTEYVKDISKIGRNIKEMIIVDNLVKNFKLNPENGIKIAPYYGANSIDDNKLFQLQKLLILFYKLKYDDLRMAIKDYSQYINNKISESD